MQGEIVSKDIMHTKGLTRIINHAYSLRAVELKELGDESTITLVEYIYDMLL